MNKGLFITFEGADGCGKTTQLNLLKDYLINKGYEVETTREPGATGLGEKFREILLNYDGVVSDKCESFLFLADRAQNIDTIVKPALNQGKIVLCDRHTDSTVAYQGYGRGLQIDQIKYLNNLATDEIIPDLTIIFDIDIDTSMKRIGKSKDRMENSGIEFFNRVRLGYIEIADTDSKRVKLINSTKTIDEVFSELIEIVDNFLEYNNYKN